VNGDGKDVVPEHRMDEKLSIIPNHTEFAAVEQENISDTF
jgi:hypothetical protein